MNPTAEHGHRRSRPIRSGLAVLGLVLAAAAPAAGQRLGSLTAADSLARARPIRFGLEQIPLVAPLSFELSLTRFSAFTRMPFRDYVREWERSVEASGQEFRTLGRRPEPDRENRVEERVPIEERERAGAARPDTIEFLPRIVARDTAGAGVALPGAISKYADLNMQVRGRGELGGSWTRFNPCDPSLQFNCNPGLFPQLKPDVQLGLLVAGTVSDRIHLDVDYDQTREETFNSNKIRVYYEGLPNEVLRHVEVGDVQFRIPRSRYLTQGIPAGNFGFMAEGQVGPVDFQTVWAQQRGDLTRREFRLGGGGTQGVVQDDEIVLDDADYVKGQFFFLVHPDSLAGAPYVDALALLPGAAPPTLRPEQGGTIQVYRDERIAATSGQQQVDLFLADAVSEDGTLKHSGQFRRLDPDQDYVIHQSGLWIMLRSPLRADEALAVAYVTESGDTVGQLNAEQSPAGVTPTLRLLRSPVASHQPGQPTWPFEMHQVYRMNSGTGVDVSTVDLRVSLGDLAGGRTFVDTPGGQVTFLRLFGLDEDAPTDKVDAVQVFQPETLQGGATGTARITGTFIIFPTLEPFRAPGPVPSEGLDAAGAQALLGADANATIYENTDPVTRESAGRFRLNFSYRVQVEGVVSSFSLGQFGIREGSEIVQLGDRRLQRDVDYTIDYDLGQITLNDAQALFGANPNAQLTVDLEQKSFFDVAPTTLWGSTLTWQLGEHGTFSLIGLYQSEKTLYARPQLGTEPAGVFMGGTSLDLRMGSAWMDRFIARAPFLRSDAESHFNLQGEIAFSAKNPNKRGVGWLDDFEGTEEVRLSARRQDWKLGSRPESPAGDEGVLPTVVDASTATRLTWQHDFTVNGAIAGSVSPHDIDNQIVVVGTAVPEPVMYLTFGDSAAAPGQALWRSITSVLSTTGRDMSRSEYFEFYAAAGVSAPLSLIFDFGTVGEDAMYVDSLGQTNGTYASDGRAWGQGILDEEARVADREVWGIDKDKRGLWDQPCLAEGIKAYPLGDPRSNCTKGNGIPDTEDLDGNGVLDANDGAYFRYVVNLDGTSPYMVRATGVAGTGTGYRLYRIPLRLGAPVNGASEGTWRFMKHVRMTVAGELVGFPRVVTLARMSIVGSRWTKRDVHGILRGFAEEDAGAGATTSEFRVGPVSRLTDGLDYQPPPGITNQAQDPTAQFGGTGVEVNEKAQRLAYTDLLPGERAEAFFRYPQQPQSLLNYRELRMWAVARNGDWGPGHSERLILKLGTDARNFYLYRTPLKAATGDAVTTADWLPEIAIDFQRWFDLRAEAEQKLLEPRPPGVTQDTIWDADSTYAIVLEDRARAPNLASIREISLAVYNAGETSVTGEVWVDDLRLDQPFQEPGAAGNVSLDFAAGDILTGTVGFSRKGAVFQQLNQSADYVSAGDISMSTGLRLDRMLPAAWGLDIPVSISHTRSSSAPRFLERSDVVASDLPGLRDTGGGSTSFGVRVSKRTPSANPLVGAIVDGTTITLGYDKANSSNVTTKNESDGFRGGIDYRREMRSLDVDAVPGFLEQALRAITPARIERSDFFAGLVGARFRWTPRQIGFGSNYSRQDSRAFRYATILEDSTDLAVKPIESPRKGLENNANIAFQPFSAIDLGLSLRSVRDLLDPDIATQQPDELAALRNARTSIGGTDLGWEVNRTMTSTFGFRPTIATWLRPSYQWSNRYGTDRNPSYIELDVDGADTTAVLQRRFGSDRQITRRLDFQPTAMINSLGTADSAGGVGGALLRVIRSVQSLSVNWNSTLGSQFDRETFQPGGGYRFGFGDLGSFRIIGADTAISAAERDDFRASSNLTLPFGAGGTVAYTRSKSEGFDVRGGRRTQEQTGWPNVHLRWPQIPVPSAVSGFVLAASANVGYERVERTSLLGLRSPQLRGSTDNQVPISLSMTFRGGLTTVYSGRVSRGTTADPTGDGESSGTNHSLQVNGIFQPPAFLKSKIRTPLGLQLAYTQDDQRRCRYQPGVEDSACTAFVDTSNRTASLQIDTQLNDLMVGLRMNWTARKSRVGTRTGTSQFQLALFGQFNLNAGQLGQAGIR